MLSAMIAQIGQNGLFGCSDEHCAMLPSVHHPRYETLRAHLKALRQGAGLTQVQLAQRLSVDQSYLSKIERGERYMDVLFYLDWCRACAVAPDEAVMKLVEAGA